MQCTDNLFLNQKRISESHRRLAVEWLMKAQTDLHLRSTTLAIAVELLDMFIATKRCHRRDLVLAGAAALWIATKREDYSCIPDEYDFRRLLKSSESEMSLVEMEQCLLQTIEFNVCFHTAMEIAIAQLSNAADELVQVRYLLALALLNSRLYRFSAEQRAEAAVHLATGRPAECASCVRALRRLEPRFGLSAERPCGFVDGLPESSRRAIEALNFHLALPIEAKEKS